MIGHRTRASLAQFLSQQDHACIAILLSKHGAQHIGFSYGSAFPLELLNFVRDLGDQAVLAVLAEVVATQSDLRFHVSPKVRFDERLHDLLQCLAMDGYRVEGKSLRQVDPSITDAPPIEDDLVRALLDSGAPCREIIVSKINDSAQSFRDQPPDYNASLTNARIALETLARDVAQALLQPNEPPPYDPDKWGSLLTFMRQRGEISLEEERGLAGVYGFVSPGAHRPVGIPEEQMTRLGRTFVLNMCWFLFQNRLSRLAGGFR